MGADLGIAVALAAGVAAVQLRADLAAAQKDLDSLSEQLTATRNERDDAVKAAAAANAKIADLERKRTPNPVPARTFRDCPEMVEVPAGKFMMGSMDGGLNERPVHEVTIGRFAVGKFEVTFADWEACIAGGGCASHKRPSDQGWGRERHPVIDVSWNDAKEYVTWLVHKTGQPYRLLTEAEWEYAARPGTTTKYAFGDAINEDQARYSDRKTAEVGSFPPNAWGLHDMHGNVWEWVEDCYQENHSGAPSDGLARSISDLFAFSAAVRGSTFLTCSARPCATGSGPRSVMPRLVSALPEPFNLLPPVLLTS